MELFDAELKGVMGDRYEEEEIPKEMPRMECSNIGPGTEAKPKRSFMDRLTTCATWLGVCGGISMLMWWFEVNGLMAMEAAFPCILACTGVGSLGVGLNIRK